MDNGYTLHSGCPVVEGKKKIVTQWIRLGVDDEKTADYFRKCKFTLFFSMFILFDYKWVSIKKIRAKQ